MWISSKRLNDLEQKLAELEHEVQIQRSALVKHISDHEQENTELRRIISNINNIKNEVLYNGTLSSFDEKIIPQSKE